MQGYIHEIIHLKPILDNEFEDGDRLEERLIANLEEESHHER